MMPEDQLITINVILAGRSYRIRIKPEEEEAVRKGVKIADEKIKDMRRNYAGKDDQDFIAMTLLTYAADASNNNNPLLAETLKDMIARIDHTIQ